MIECDACEGRGEHFDEDEDSDGRKAYVVRRCRICLGLGQVEPEEDEDEL